MVLVFIHCSSYRLGFGAWGTWGEEEKLEFGCWLWKSEEHGKSLGKRQPFPASCFLNMQKRDQNKCEERRELEIIESYFYVTCIVICAKDVVENR